MIINNFAETLYATTQQMYSQVLELGTGISTIQTFLIGMGVISWFYTLIMLIWIKNRSVLIKFILTLLIVAFPILGMIYPLKQLIMKVLWKLIKGAAPSIPKMIFGVISSPFKAILSK